MISETCSVDTRRLKVTISHLSARRNVRRSIVPPFRAIMAMARSRSNPKCPSPEWNCPSKSIQRVTCTVNAVAHSTAARVIMGFAGFSESAQRIGMGRHLICGGDFGAERRCSCELSKKQDDDMDNLKVGDRPRGRPILRGVVRYAASGHVCAVR